MLTRNLYREDEVIASLQFCILRRRCVEAAFWATELIESNMITEFFNALRSIWLLGFGINALPWFAWAKELEARDELETDSLLSLVIGLARCDHDTSYLSLAGTSSPAEQVGFGLVPKGLTGVDAFFAAAVIQGRCITAWRALPSIGDGTVAIVAKHKHEDSGMRLLEICEYPSLLVAALCLPRGELEKRLAKPIPSMLDEVVDAVTEWEALSGRSRRVYAIPYEALYWVTARGNTVVYETIDSELRGSLERRGRLWGSVFWDSVAEDLGGWPAVRADANTREAFYAQYFPDDIPDEWSLADRAKSHGSGCMQPGTSPCLSRFLQTWFGRYSSAVLWNEFDVSIKNIQAKSLSDISAPLCAPVELNLTRVIRRVVPI